MLCEKHKDALIEAAVSGEELAPAVRAHVETCASCAADLAGQRSLLAAIDGNVSRQMNAPVPAAMFQRLVESLAQQPQPKRAARFAQIFAGGFAALGTAAIILVFLVHPRVQRTGPNAKTIAVPPIKSSNANRAQDDGAAAAQVTAARKHQPRTPSDARRRTAGVVNASTPREPEIIVPPDERIALAHFIAQSRTQEQLVAVLVTPPRRNSDQPLKHIEIPDIRTADIAIAPMNEETRR